MDLQALLKKMTLKEKCYQLQQVNSQLFLDDTNMPVTGPDFFLQFDKDYMYEVASVYNSFGAERNIKIQKEFLEKSKNKIPLAFMLDIIHGYRTIYPINLGLASSFDRALVRECAQMAAKEAVQLYIRDLFGSVVRPIKELKGFEKIELCPGEEKTVEFKIDINTLKFVRRDLSYGAEKGEFQVFIGKDSTCQPFATFTLI